MPQFIPLLGKKYNFLLGKKKGGREVWGGKTGFFCSRGSHHKKEKEAAFFNL